MVARISPAAASLALWSIAVVAVAAPLMSRVLLLGPLVVAPALLARMPQDRRGFGRPLRRLGGWCALIAALPLIVAVALPAGLVAAALTLPWLAVAVAGVVAGVTHGLRRLPGLLHPRHTSELGVDVALGFFGVGALFLTLERLGVRPLDFPTAIIVLTAVHFHVAGFGLLGYAALRTGAAGGPSWVDRLAAGATFGLVVGMPVTAAGFVLPSTAVNALGAVMVGVSGIAVAVIAVVDTRRTVGIRRLALIFASACLLGGMPLGIAWAVAPLLDVTFLDLESMVRTHGLLNAVAVVILVHVPVAGSDPGEEAHSTR